MDPNSLPDVLGSPWWKDILLVLIGGLCAVAGSALTTILSVAYQTKKARQGKMEETIGEQKVEAYKKALSLISQLRSSLIVATHDDTLSFMSQNREWVSDNIILLPHTFVENWRTIQVRLPQAKRRAKAANGNRRDQMIREQDKIESFVDSLAEEMEENIRNELGLPQVKIRRLPKDQQEQ